MAAAPTQMKNQSKERVLTPEQLDRELDPLVEDPTTYEERAAEVARRLDRDGVGLELRPPESWRRARRPMARVASIEEQLRAEIDSILLLDREGEARLARRIELARLRLESALEREGIPREQFEALPSGPTDELDSTRCALPAVVCQRANELHSLRTELVERNLYLGLINVERYAYLHVSRLDLIQEGSAALFRAVDGFDWRRGLLFRTYAVHWLNQAFRSFLYNFGNTVRVPVYLQKAMKHVNQAIETLGGKASPEAIAEEADLGVHLVESALAASRSTLSMDTPVGAQDGSGLSEILGLDTDEEVYTTDMEEVSLEDGIHSAMERLSERERYVIQKRFGIGSEREHTLAEVAAELGVSLERIRQIQVRAISKMRTPGLRKAIDPFLEI